MSLIEEALRRVQDQTVSKVQTPAPPETQAEPSAPPHSWSPAPAAPRTPGTNVLALVGAAIFLVTAALLIGGVIWIGRALSHRPADVGQSAPLAPSAQAPEASGTTAGPRAPSRAAKAPASGEYVLSGVVEGSGEPLAMINGEILAIGDRVGAATLVAITPQQVTLHLDTGEQRIVRNSP